jgi:hypothetical protein
VLKASEALMRKTALIAWRPFFSQGNPTLVRRTVMI